MGKLVVGRLTTCCAESTCWIELVTAARKVRDIDNKTDVEMDGAVDAAVDSDCAETDCGGFPLDSGTRDKASYIADWLLRIFLM